jgi:hypothetical protein
MPGKLYYGPIGWVGGISPVLRELIGNPKTRRNRTTNEDAANQGS